MHAPRRRRPLIEDGQAGREAQQRAQFVRVLPAHWCGADTGQQLGEGAPGVDADDGVHFRQIPRHLFRVALREAAGGDQLLAGPLLLAQLQQSVDRLLLGDVDEAAGVHDNDVGVGGAIHRHMADAAQGLVQRFGIDSVLWAAASIDIKVHALDFQLAIVDEL